MAPGAPDLSDADFEFPSGGFADNPAVPNLSDVGPRGFPPQGLTTIDHTWFLAAPLDVSSLPVLARNRRGESYLGVPREALFDVVANIYLWSENDLAYPDCIPPPHPVYDRLPSFTETGGNPAFNKSLQRRVLRTSPGGWPILMNTNTSAVDIRWVPFTPGELP